MSARSVGCVRASMALAVALAGCGQSSARSVPVEEVASEYAVVICDVLADCTSEALVELLFAPGGGSYDCVEAATRSFEQRNLPALEAAIAAGTIVYDGTAVDACLSGYAGLGCGFFSTREPQACRQVFAGTQALGEPCEINLECASADSYCAIDGMCPGTCTTRVGVGVTCTGDDACQNGLICQNGTCQAQPVAGATCGGMSGLRCTGDQQCVGGGDGEPGTCRPWSALLTADVGAACDLSEGPFCRDGLSFAVTAIAGMPPVGTFACEAEVGAGAACHAAVPDECPTGQYCGGLDLPMLDIEGTCMPLPAAGACAMTLTGLACAAGSTCVAGTCTLLREIGGACASGAECYSGRCESGACVAADPCP
jgi:hypothetical protein